MKRADWMRLAALLLLAASVVVAELVSPGMVPEAGLVVPLAGALLILLPVVAGAVAASEARKSRDHSQQA